MPKTENLAIYWELRDGDVVTSGYSGGKRSWIEHAKHGDDNTSMRAKQAAGIARAKTKPLKDGDGDVSRKLDDGRTLHVWRRHDIDPDMVEDLNTLYKTHESLNDEGRRLAIDTLILDIERKLSEIEEMMC